MTEQALEQEPDSDTGYRTPDTGEYAVVDGEARTRAHTREGSGEPDAGDTPGTDSEIDDDTETDPVDGGEVSGWRARLRWVATEFAPLEWWSVPPASGQQVLDYAKKSPWAPAKGAARTAGRIYAYGVAIPLTLVGYILAWVAQRPARAVLALVIYLILRQTTLGSIVLPY